MDQNTSLAEGVFVDFFGVSACANVGLAKIAARSGAAVVPGFAVWEAEEARYVLRFFPPVEISGDAREDTQRLHSILESVIRRNPDQWLWIHRRWKTRPPGIRRFTSVRLVEYPVEEVPQRKPYRLSWTPGA